MSRSRVIWWRRSAWRRCPDRVSTRIPRPAGSGFASTSPGGMRPSRLPCNGSAASGVARRRPDPHDRPEIRMSFFHRNPPAPPAAGPRPRRGSFGPLAAGMALSLLLGFGLARGLHATDDLRSQLDLFSQILYLVQNNYVEP